MELKDILDVVFNGLGVALASFVIYLLNYYIKKYSLDNWVTKAVNAAEIMFDIPNSSAEKKEWVLNFLKSNGLVNGISDAALDALIEAAVNTLNIEQGKVQPKLENRAIVMGAEKSPVKTTPKAPAKTTKSTKTATATKK